MALAVVDKQNVERSGVVETRGFQIAATAEAFRILSDGLYSDKVTAVLRELGTNAIDAHVEAGTLDKPFVVHLPSSVQPWLKLRDFGTGMEHDKVMNLYSTYFGTDKLENPNVVGQLGLGSKSPLSYTRSFTVTSYRNGRKNQYVVMLNEDRLPEINHLPEQSGTTTEPNGLEIQIAVRHSDFNEFCNKAASVYRYFSKRPQVEGNTNYRIVEPEILVQGKGWRIYKDTGSAKAVMGNIAYPIQWDKIHDITAHQRTILGCNIEVDFPIGALEFTPSRETLSYKKRTSEVLRNRLDEIVAEVNAEVAKRFENCKSLWEARVLAYTLFWSSNSSVDKLLDLANLRQLADICSITYKGEKLTGQQLHFDKIEGVEGWSFALIHKYRHNWCQSKEDFINIGRVKRFDRKYFTPRQGVKWLEVDLPRGSYSRCQDVIRRQEAEEVYLVAFHTPEARKEFCAVMGLNGDEFIKTSTLPKPVIQRGVFHQSTSQVYKHNGSTGEYRLYKYWSEAEVDLSDGGVYVEMRRNQAFVDGKVVNPQVIGKIIEGLKQVGHNIEVIGVRPTVAKQFRKSDDWVDVFTYVKNLLHTQMVSNNLGKHLANVDEIGKIGYVSVWETIISKMNNANVPLADASPFKQFVDKVRALIKSRALVKDKGAWRTLAEHVNHNLKGLAEHSMYRTAETMVANYPMLSLVLEADRYGDLSVNLSNARDILAYVKLVDEQNGITVDKK